MRSALYGYHMTTTSTPIGTTVQILSVNGRITGYGTVTALKPNLIIVAKSNGRSIALHPSLVRRTATAMTPTQIEIESKTATWRS